MSQLFAVSKENIDVLGTAGTVPNNLIFSSDYNTLKYHVTGTKSVVCSGTTAHGTISHSLGYNPFFLVYSSVGLGTTLWYMLPWDFFDGPTRNHFTADVDNNNMYIHCYTNSASGTLNFKYVIFRNNLGL